MELLDFGQADLSGKKILLVGYGVEGRGTADFLLPKKVSLYIYDQKPEKEFDPEEIEQLKASKAQLFFGVKSVPENLHFDYVIRSPGIPLDSKVLSDLKSRGNKIISATQIFFALSPSQIIGVTGTKGKGTTSALLTDFLLADGQDAYLGGNIGIPALSILSKVKEDSVVVLEMSSFQLEDLQVSPHIAVLLMIEADHLDYHHNLESYHQAKANITKHQGEKDFLVFNPDYPATFKIAASSKAQKFGVSVKEELQQGCYATKKHIYIVQNGEKRKLIELSEVQLPGRHNLENICAAAMAASLAGVNEDVIKETIKKFRGLEHRLEFVRDVDGVLFYNDSFSTNPASTIAAIKAFPNAEVLILGGSSKGANFTELAKTIVSHRVHSIIGIDPEWQRIKEEINKELRAQEREGEIEYFENEPNMEWIVKAAKEHSFPGDVVLLSPGCASFGMFKNYKERGKKFKEAVNSL